MRLNLQMVQGLLTQLDLLVSLHLITYKCQLSDNGSIFSAIKAFEFALDETEQSRRIVIIFSDSVCILQTLHNRHIETPLLSAILSKHIDLSNLTKNVFCQIPSHVGNKDNETTDIVANSAI